MNILVKGKFINAEIISRVKDDNPELSCVLKIKSPVSYDVDIPKKVNRFFEKLSDHHLKFFFS